MFSAVSVLERIKRTDWCMASVAASSTIMRPHPLVSYAASSESEFAGTNGTECRVTGFPIGFGGWTAAKMYDRNINNNNQQRTVSEINTDSAARQEVGLSCAFCFYGCMLDL